MFKKLTNGCVNLVQKYLPDAFLFAILLTGIVFILGIIFNHETPMGMIVHWGEGFWGLLAFSMQMALVVILGNALANAPLFKKIIKTLARIPKTPKHAVAFVAVVAAIATMIQWGFGLVFGAILAKEVAKSVRNVDYRLLIAASYSAFMFSILTSSIHLKAASNPDDLLKVTSGVLDHVIPLTQTSYHVMTIAALVAFIILFPIALSAMHPTPEQTISIDPSLLMDEPEEAPLDKKSMTPAERLENSSIVSILVFVAGAVYIMYFFIKGNSLTIDMMNFLLFMFGILLHKNPMAYIRAITEAATSCVGILLQFPFYAGIMGMMTGINAATGTTLAGVISAGIVSVATVKTFPLFTFLSAALVNMFVPSAGGQWAVQAPVMFPAAQALGADYAITTVAMTWGDTWTNMIQPFWALPALAIAGLKVRDIMGYCVMILLISGVVIVADLLIWSYCLL
ncbi:MAG: short-chain fatty acid transporter [Anaerovoracaceae bacterium]